MSKRVRKWISSLDSPIEGVLRPVEEIEKPAVEAVEDGEDGLLLDGEEFVSRKFQVFVEKSVFVVGLAGGGLILSWK